MTQGMAVLWLIWLGMPSALMFLTLTGLFPPPLSVVTPVNLFFAFLETELFLILIVLPLFQPLLFKRNVASGSDTSSPSSPFVQIVALMLLGAPLAAICAIVSGIGLETVARALLILRVFMTAILAMGRYSSAKGARVLPIYYLVVFTLSAGLPFLYYLGLEYDGISLEEMAYISPFWGMIHVVGNGGFAHLWIVQSSATLALSALFLFLARDGKPLKAQLT